MKKEMDKIQFESRCEIEDIHCALEIFLKEHPNHHSVKEVRCLKDKLEVMHMEW